MYRVDVHVPYKVHAEPGIGVLYKRVKKIPMQTTYGGYHAQYFEA